MSLPDTTRIPATRESADGAVFYVVVCTATDGTQYAVEKRYSRASCCLRANFSHPPFLAKAALLLARL